MRDVTVSTVSVELAVGLLETTGNMDGGRLSGAFFRNCTQSWPLSAVSGEAVSGE
jgi:hypothetical protein